MSEEAINIVSELMASNPTITALAIVSSKDQVLWQTSGWNIQGSRIISAWMNREPSVIVQGVKYSTFQAEPEKFIAKNLFGYGYIVATPLTNELFLVAYVAPEGDPKAAFVDLYNAAIRIRKVI